MNGGFGPGFDDNLPAYICNAPFLPFRGTSRIMIIPFAIEATVSQCEVASFDTCGQDCEFPEWNCSWLPVDGATGYYICASAEYDITTTDGVRRVKWYSFVGFVNAPVTSVSPIAPDDGLRELFGEDGVLVEGSESCRVFAVQDGCGSDEILVQGFNPASPQLDE